VDRVEPRPYRYGPLDRHTALTPYLARLRETAGSRDLFPPIEPYRTDRFPRKKRGAEWPQRTNAVARDPAKTRARIQDIEEA
jgi:hypothetical protein